MESWSDCFHVSFSLGYVFPTPNDVLPYLEEPRTGVTSLFCQELAKSLGCYVVGGYPEKLAPDEEKPKDREVVGANSAVIYNPAGEWVGGYRKTNLFEADLPWVKAGKVSSYIPYTSILTVYIIYSSHIASRHPM